MFEDEKDQPLTVAQIKKFQNTDFSVVESKFKILPITGNTDLFKSLGDEVSIANANIFSIEDVDTVSHSKIYNKLLYIEDSDRKLKQFPHFEKFLKASEEVVCRYDLAEHVGLRLIHRHFDLQEGQIMIENFQVVKDVPSLVTNAYNILDFHQIRL